MSYLVDALKKAERERHDSQTGDLHAAAGMRDTARRGASSPWRWLVAILLAGNVALALYIWRPQPFTPTTARTDAPVSRASGPVEGGNRRSDIESAQAALLAATPKPDISAAIGDTSATAIAAPRSETSSSSGSTGPASGSVVYSSMPLTSRSSSDASSRQTRTADPDDAGGGAAGDIGTRQGATPRTDKTLPMQSDLSVPQVTINGELYSSMPGRSFILVDGRTYHEGERLAAGPAVEQIEANGAILNYKGQRYRVSGPG